MSKKPRRKAKTGLDIIDKGLVGSNLTIAIVAGAALVISVLTLFAVDAEARASERIADAAAQQVEAANRQVDAAQQQVVAAEAQLLYVEAQAEAAQSQAEAAQAQAISAQQQLDLLRQEQSERFRPWIGLDESILWVFTSNNIWVHYNVWCEIETIDCTNPASFEDGVQKFQIELIIHNFGEQPALSIMRRSLDSIEMVPSQVELLNENAIGPSILMPSAVTSILSPDIDKVSFVGALFGDNPYYFMYRTEYKGLDGRDGFYQVTLRWSASDGVFLMEQESAG